MCSRRCRGFRSGRLRGLGFGVADLLADERSGRNRFRGRGCGLRLLDGPLFHGELHRPGAGFDRSCDKEQKRGKQVRCFHGMSAFPGEVAISGGILPEKALQIKPYFRRAGVERMQ